MYYYKESHFNSRFAVSVYFRITPLARLLDTPLLAFRLLKKMFHATPSKIFVILGKEKLKFFANNDRTIDDDLAVKFCLGIFANHILNQPRPGVSSIVVNEEVSVFFQDDL